MNQIQLTQRVFLRKPSSPWSCQRWKRCWRKFLTWTKSVNWRERHERLWSPKPRLATHTALVSLDRFVRRWNSRLRTANCSGFAQKRFGGVFSRRRYLIPVMRRLMVKEVCPVFLSMTRLRPLVDLTLSLSQIERGPAVCHFEITSGRGDCDDGRISFVPVDRR